MNKRRGFFKILLAAPLAAYVALRLEPGDCWAGWDSDTITRYYKRWAPGEMAYVRNVRSCVPDRNGELVGLSDVEGSADGMHWHSLHPTAPLVGVSSELKVLDPRGSWEAV